MALEPAIGCGFLTLVLVHLGHESTFFGKNTRIKTVKKKRI